MSSAVRFFGRPEEEEKVAFEDADEGYIEERS
jgi:hypothetical protein